MINKIRPKVPLSSPRIPPWSRLLQQQQQHEVWPDQMSSHQVYWFVLFSDGRGCHYNPLFALVHHSRPLYSVHSHSPSLSLGDSLRPSWTNEFTMRPRGKEHVFYIHGITTTTYRHQLNTLRNAAHPHPLLLFNAIYSIHLLLSLSLLMSFASFIYPFPGAHCKSPSAHAIHFLRKGRSLYGQTVRRSGGLNY